MKDTLLELDIKSHEYSFYKQLEVEEADAKQRVEIIEGKHSTWLDMRRARQDRCTGREGKSRTKSSKSLTATLRALGLLFEAMTNEIL